MDSEEKALQQLDWIARMLAQHGGSQPDLEDIPRRRPSA
jgi:hypothetical protein